MHQFPLIDFIQLIQSPDATSELDYLWRRAPNQPHPKERRRWVGEVGWGLEKLTDWRAPQVCILTSIVIHLWSRKIREVLSSMHAIGFDRKGWKIIYWLTKDLGLFDIPSTYVSTLFDQTGFQIQRKVYRQGNEDRHMHRMLTAWWPGPGEYMEAANSKENISARGSRPNYSYLHLNHPIQPTICA